MKIAIAADHGGFEMKQQLIEHYAGQGIVFHDLGTSSLESVDYPDYAALMSQEILTKKADLGILVCGTGIGISIAANRHKGIRAAILYNEQVAALSRQHNNANVAVFGGRTMPLDEVIKAFDVFLKTEFEGGRHSRRIGKMDLYGEC